MKKLLATKGASRRRVFATAVLLSASSLCFSSGVSASALWAPSGEGSGSVHVQGLAAKNGQYYGTFNIYPAGWFLGAVDLRAGIGVDLGLKMVATEARRFGSRGTIFVSTKARWRCNTGYVSGALGQSSGTTAYSSVVGCPRGGYPIQSENLFWASPDKSWVW